MEISVVSPGALKIKGKKTTLFVNGSAQPGSPILLLGNKEAGAVKLNEDDVVIDGPGEFEVGGVKMSGVRAGNAVVYTMAIDTIFVTVGSVKALEVLQKSLHESQVVVIDADETGDVSFISTFSPNVVLFYNDKATDIAKSIAKEAVTATPKYQVTADKLPVETETYILATGK